MTKKMLGKILSVVLTLILVFSIMPTTTVNAKGETWISLGDGWYALDGTDIKVEITSNTIHITGTGAIPDYDERSLSERPWHNATCKTLIIDNTITSIGTYAFSYLNLLEDITLSSTTFIAATNSFTGSANEPVFHIKGYAETVNYIGTIPYTSLDSIKFFAENNSNYASFVLDEWYMVSLFQNSTNPTIANVYCRYDTTKPWENVTDNLNGNKSTEFCTLASANPNGNLALTAKQCYIDSTYYEAFSSVIENYSLATTFTMELEREGLVTVRKTLYPLYYKLTIPEEYRQAGRSFRILSMAQGTVEVLEDLDTDDTTVTFMTQYPTSTFALVYLP